MRLLLKDVPNCLSLSRIPIAAIFLVLFDSDSESRFWWSFGFLCLAVLTDFFDGQIARAYGISSRTGYFIDGIGDKAVYTAVLLVIFREDRQQYLLPWLLIIREIILYALRAIEGAKSDTLKKLRKLSLLYALFIRLYFMAFLFQAAFKLHHLQIYFFTRWYISFGIIAAAFGYAYLYFLIKQMAQSLSPR